MGKKRQIEVVKALIYGFLDRFSFRFFISQWLGKAKRTRLELPTGIFSFSSCGEWFASPLLLHDAAGDLFFHAAASEFQGLSCDHFNEKETKKDQSLSRLKGNLMKKCEILSWCEVINKIFILMLVKLESFAPKGAKWSSILNIKYFKFISILNRF